MRILVCGGRFYANENKIFKTLDKAKSVFVKVHIIHGGADGADTIAGRWAISRNVEYTKFPAKWTEYGRKAGFIRNKQMLDEGKPDLVIAFQGQKGTRMMIELAEKAGIPVREIKEHPYDILKD